MTTSIDSCACTFAIADLPLTVSADAALIAALRKRYAAFLQPDGASTFTAQIERAGHTPRATDDRPLVFRADGAHFTTPDYAGHIDLAQQQAALTLNSATPVEDADYFIRTIYALRLFEAGGLLFHAAGLVRHARGYLFFGQSGSGKTTVSRLSPEAIVLNDDLVALMPRAGQWHMHATPFSNPTQVALQHAPASPRSAIVSGAYRLIQDQRVYVEDLPPALAVAEIVASSPIVCADPARTLDLITRARQLHTAVPIRHLHFLPDSSFWKVVDQGSGNGVQGSGSGNGLISDP
jgi:hypothetical protein